MNIGLLGCGTVGQGVIELTRRRSSRIAELTGHIPEIKKVLVRDLEKQRDVRLQGEELTRDAASILEDSEIDVVIECIGGIDPAREYLLTAIRQGKHVVTANKDLIAAHGPEILAEARKHQVTVWYEASVGGAIPLVGPLQQSLTANEVTEMKGILNGTTNYILTQMHEAGCAYDDALQEAQDQGFAEADPTSDVDGWDAARKLVILSSIAFHSDIDLSEVRVEGIRAVSDRDVAYAKELNCVIKLLAVGLDGDGRLALTVRPTMVPLAHPLAQVSGSFNALFVRGDAAGELMFYGRGAGSMPTASAVVGDLIAALRGMEHASTFSNPLVLEKSIASSGPPTPYYLRLTALDRPGVFAEIAAVVGIADISMETVLQRRSGADTAEIVIVTHVTTEAQIEALRARLLALAFVKDIHMVMPLELLVE